MVYAFIVCFFHYAYHVPRVVVHNRDCPCFSKPLLIRTHTQTQTGEVTIKAMKAIELYFFMLLVLWKVWCLKELIS